MSSISLLVGSLGQVECLGVFGGFFCCPRWLLWCFLLGGGIRN